MVGCKLLCSLYSSGISRDPQLLFLLRAGGNLLPCWKAEQSLQGLVSFNALSKELKDPFVCRADTARHPAPQSSTAQPSTHTRSLQGTHSCWRWHAALGAASPGSNPYDAQTQLSPSGLITLPSHIQIILSAHNIFLDIPLIFNETAHSKLDSIAINF